MNKHSVITAFQRVMLTIWIGGMWSVGYLAAPVLFKNLQDWTLAGELAGKMFYLTGMIGLTCAILLLLSMMAQSGSNALKQWRSMLIVLMCIITAAGLFYFQPQIALLKQSIADVSTSIEFKRLHGISQGLHLLVSLSGLLLVLTWRSDSSTGN